MADAEIEAKVVRIMETRGWRKSADSRFLSVDLRKRLVAPEGGLHLLLRPSPSFHAQLPDAVWGRKLELPPCRLIWIGDVVASPTKSRSPCFEALVQPLMEDENGTACEILTLPMSVLALMRVARVLKGLDRDHDHRGPEPVPVFRGHRRMVQFWITPSEMAIVTAAEIPALSIGTLSGYPRFATTPLCVIADRPAKRLLIIPCWEVFRYYYARSPAVARMVFLFPSWTSRTRLHLLKYFDGHRFGRFPRRESAFSEHAWQRLQAIGRDAVVGYVQTGRTQIRVVPPFYGGGEMCCVAQAVRMGYYETLFVQEILYSFSSSGERGVIRWEKHRGESR